jgi:hypothetical protein
MNDRRRDKSLRASSNTAAVDYASPFTPRPTRSRLDFAMLICAGIQFVCAIFLCIACLREVSRGHYELAFFRVARLPPEEPGLLIRVAWSVFKFDTWASFAWLIGSAALIVAAMDTAPARRRPLYLVYPIVWAVCLAAVLLSLLILRDAQLSYRWRAGLPPAPDTWKMFVVESTWIWQLPSMFLIANPAIILLGWRTLGTLRPGDDRI